MTSNNKVVPDIIEGIGIYDLPGLIEQRWIKVASSFGKPSNEFLH